MYNSGSEKEMYNSGSAVSFTTFRKKHIHITKIISRAWIRFKSLVYYQSLNFSGQEFAQSVMMCKWQKNIVICVFYFSFFLFIFLLCKACDVVYPKPQLHHLTGTILCLKSDFVSGVSTVAL